jgi:hypothetical protein
MTSEVKSQEPQDQKQNDKEFNFRQLESKYEKQLAQERQERIQERAAREKLEREMQEIRTSFQQSHSEEEADEPYVDHKRLDKKLSAFEKKLEEKIEKKAEEKARNLMAQQGQNDWLRQNPDFYDVLQHAEKFANANPDLADTILRMPDGFERQKLVYANIKALGIHKPVEKQPSIQDKVDANRRTPYYQPSGIATSPYAAAGDFSASGQKQAYQKMQELKNKLRLG